MVSALSSLGGARAALPPPLISAGGFGTFGGRRAIAEIAQALFRITPSVLKGQAT